MAINKKLIHFKNRNNFSALLAPANGQQSQIQDLSIVFVKDSSQIWTHGHTYNCIDDAGYAYVNDEYKKIAVDEIVTGLHIEEVKSLIYLDETNRANNITEVLDTTGNRFISGLTLSSNEVIKLETDSIENTCYIYLCPNPFEYNFPEGTTFTVIPNTNLNIIELENTKNEGENIDNPYKIRILQGRKEDETGAFTSFKLYSVQNYIKIENIGSEDIPYEIHILKNNNQTENEELEEELLSYPNLYRITSQETIPDIISIQDAYDSLYELVTDITSIQNVYDSLYELINLDEIDFNTKISAIKDQIGDFNINLYNFIYNKVLSIDTLQSNIYFVEDYFLDIDNVYYLYNSTLGKLIALIGTDIGAYTFSYNRAFSSKDYQIIPVLSDIAPWARNYKNQQIGHLKFSYDNIELHTDIGDLIFNYDGLELNYPPETKIVKTIELYNSETNPNPTYRLYKNCKITISGFNDPSITIPYTIYNNGTSTANSTLYQQNDTIYINNIENDYIDLTLPQSNVNLTLELEKIITTNNITKYPKAPTEKPETKFLRGDGTWNTITIPDTLVQADWSEDDTSKLSYILNKPSLANVATSGSYNDLTDKPSIPIIPTNVSAFINDANYATTSDVSTAISNLVNSAPDTLNTLNELASALGDDANFSTTVTNSIAEAKDIANRKLIDYSKEYLTFEAIEDTTFTFLQNELQYSLDNGKTWETLPANTASPPITVGNKIMWKQKELTLNNNSGIGRFTSTHKFKAYGNIMSLYYEDNFIGQTNLIGKNYAFFNLFYNNNNLIDVSNLILAATTLSQYCYGQMFFGCTSLTNYPLLYATTLANNCYFCMFMDCISLTTAPKLPVTTLVDYCYYGMFAGCTSLISAPELPATTLVSSCYDQMFAGCTSLISAPELPATTLVYECYQMMFYNCTSLNYIKCLATDISATGCTTNWIGGVAQQGIFVKGNNANWSSKTGDNGIPSDWKVHTENEYKEVRNYELTLSLQGIQAGIPSLIGYATELWVGEQGYLTSQNITGKADKVNNPTSGNFAALDANGNLIDSGHKHDDYITDMSGKLDTLFFNTAYNSSTNKVATMADLPTSLPANGGNAATVNNHTVYSDVPTNAVFTDTTYSTMGASGNDHAEGLVPDTPTTTGTSLFLREDATWAEPDISGKLNRMSIQIGQLDNNNQISLAVDNYYKFSTDITNARFNLPYPTSNNTEFITLSFTTGTTINSITFHCEDSNHNPVNLKYFDNFTMVNNAEYEVNCMWNGQTWIIADTLITPSNNN